MLSNSSLSPGGPRSGFRSFKTQVSVVYPARWHRDILIQLTLDPAIQGIAPSPVDATTLGFGHRAFAVLAEKGGRPVIVAVTPEEFDYAHPATDVPVVVISRAQLTAEPRASTARSVWASRHATVTLGDRIRVLTALDAAGDGLPLCALMNLVEAPGSGPAPTVLALVCLGVLELDTVSDLGPHTMIRRREICASVGRERLIALPSTART